MKRKAWMLAVALIAAMAVTACGKDDDDKKKDTGVEQDTGVPEDTSMDTGEADTTEEDTGAEDTSVADTDEEDTGVEDTGPEDTGQPDTDQPDTSMDTGQPDTAMPDTGTDADAGMAMFEEVNCGAGAADAQVAVGVANMKVYMPANVNIDVGDVVQWTSAGGTHNVTADDDTDCGSARSDWFASSNMNTGDNYCVRFNQAGTWNYHCTVGAHCAAGMKGTVTVN